MRASGFIPFSSIHLFATLLSLFGDIPRLSLISFVRSHRVSSERTEETCFSGTIRRSVFIVSTYSLLFSHVSSPRLYNFCHIFFYCKVYSLSCLSGNFTDIFGYYYSFCYLACLDSCTSSSDSCTSSNSGNSTYSCPTC